MKKLLLLLLIASCTTNHEDKLHDQSVKNHNQALKIGTQVQGKINRIDSLISSLTEEKSTIAVLIDSLTSIKEDYAYWESTIVEVPGHEHDHEHHNHHDHNHDQEPNLTPEMILAVQQDLKERIEKLNDRTQELLSKASIYNE